MDDKIKRIGFPFTGTMVGGSYVSASLIAKQLVNTPGWEPVIFLPSRGPNFHLFRETGIEVIVYDCSEELVAKARHTRSFREKVSALTAYFAIYRAAKRILRQSNLSILHINDSRTMIIWGLAARHCRIPIVWHVREEAGNRFIDPLRAHLASCIIFVAESIKKRFRKRPRIPQWVVHNWVDTQHYMPRTQQPGAISEETNDSQRITVGFIGNLVDRKRPDWAVGAVVELLDQGIDVELQLVGSDLGRKQMSFRLQKQAGKYNGQQIILNGYRDDIPQFLNSVDVFVLTSAPEGEAFPRAILEAMASGLACLATDVAGVSEAVTNQVDGELCCPSNYPEFVDKLRNLVLDSELRATYGGAARQTVVNRFSTQVVFPQLVEIYNWLLDGSYAR